MEYLRLLYDLPAVVAGSVIVAYLSPWQFRARFAPLVMFVIGLLVLCAPQLVDLALALTIPAAWLVRALGIDVYGQVPLKVTLPRVRFRNVQVRQFVEGAYPVPGSDGEPVTEYGEGAAGTTVKSFVPRI